MSIYTADALAGDVVILTGATGGIGTATAKTLARMGASLVLTGRDGDALAAVKQDAKSVAAGGKVATVRADITDDDDRRGILDASENLGGVTILVNAAGVTDERTDFEDVTREQLTRVMNVNYTSTVLLTQLVYERLLERTNGSIVNVSSLSGLRGVRRSIPYSASKFALTGFTQALATEAIEHGIRVNAVCPGWVDTEMARSGIRSKAATQGRSYEEQFEHERSNIPSNRITEPEEVANAIAFLLTDAAENVVGESLKLSGGSVLR